MELTENEKQAFARYNYDDVILYLRGAGMSAKSWHIGSFGFLYVSISSITRESMLSLAAAVPNAFTILCDYTDHENEFVLKGLCIRFSPSTKTSSRDIKDWL